MKTTITTLIAAAVLSACSTTPAPEPISWRLEREAYQARVAMHECRKEVQAGRRADCKPEIQMVYDTSQARIPGRYADIGGAGYIGIK